MPFATTATEIAMRHQQAMYDTQRRQMEMLSGLGGLGQGLVGQAISSGRSIEQERTAQWPHLTDGRGHLETHNPIGVMPIKKKFTQTLREQLQTETDMWLSDI